MTNKQFGRVGDSPIIGAGTYADNTGLHGFRGPGRQSCFIRHAVAHDIAARMKYQGLSVQDAAAEVMNRLPKEPGGVGGVIALDAQGNLAMPFNTDGMYRGYVTAGQRYVLRGHLRPVARRGTTAIKWRRPGPCSRHGRSGRALDGAS